MPGDTQQPRCEGHRSCRRCWSPRQDHEYGLDAVLDIASGGLAAAGPAHQILVPGDEHRQGGLVPLAAGLQKFIICSLIHVHHSIPGRLRDWTSSFQEMGPYGHYS
jgi:hypothetical protein